MIIRDFGLVAGTIIAASTATNVAGQPVSYDFNNDGSSDYPVSVVGYDASTPAVGAARVWSGASKSIIHTIESAGTNTLFGWSIGSAGDLNGDGFDDLIVGEPLWSATSNYEGRVQVFSGADASVLLTITGGYVDTGLGRYVAGIGDWDGDGTGDIAASGWDIADTDGDGIGDDAIGMVYIYSGVNGALLTEIVEPTATATFGYSVFGLGDITGDGMADIAISDPHAELIPGSGTPGQLYIFEGSAIAGSYDLTDAYRTISNSNSGTRVFAAQVDVMHPDLWLDEPTLQIISMTLPGNGGANQAPIAIDILKADGTASGTKGTRSSLQLAGDINLDGKVDAADLQDSISQLGTDPQAIGVMPIADSNKDGIIDMLDVQVVMDGYGGATDIYEGLWDGSRLLSVAAIASGFGSTASLSGGGLGGTQWGGGRRPTDDCPPAIIAPTHITASLVPTLLREDAERSCGQCPSRDDDPTCYTCDEPKGVAGGSVIASPEQPLTTELVYFTVQGVTEIPGTWKCKDSCGDDGRTEPTSVGNPRYIWQVMYKNSDGSWPEKADPNDPFDTFDGWETGDQVGGYNGESCQEIRAICWARPSSPCLPDPLYTEIGEAEAKFADFSIEIECDAATPTNKDRNKIGILEGVTVRVVEPGVSVEWTVTVGTGPPGPPTTGENIHFTAPFLTAHQTETVVVAATSASCTRQEVFTVVTPQSVKFDEIVCKYHAYGTSSAGFAACVIIMPDDVSFTGLGIAEDDVLASVITGHFSTPAENWAEFREHEGWANAISENNKLPSHGQDRAVFMMPYQGDSWVESNLTWPIPWLYGAVGYSPQEFQVVNQVMHIEAMSGQATITKLNGDASYAVDAQSRNGPDYGWATWSDCVNCN